MDRLNDAVISHLESRLLDLARLRILLEQLLDRREDSMIERRQHVAEMASRATEAEAKLSRLYEAIENGLVDMGDPSLKARITELNAIREQARGDADRAGPPASGGRRGRRGGGIDWLFGRLQVRPFGPQGPDNPLQVPYRPR
jgi:hypothetical protein